MHGTVRLRLRPQLFYFVHVTDAAFLVCLLVCLFFQCWSNSGCPNHRRKYLDSLLSSFTAFPCLDSCILYCDKHGTNLARARGHIHSRLRQPDKDLLEKADAGKDLLDVFLKLTVCGGKGNICGVGDAAAATAGS